MLFITDIRLTTTDRPRAGPTRDELLEQYLYLVTNVVNRLKLNLPSHIEADDLRSVGITGLMAAIGKFDPEKRNTFAGYATLRIRGAILDELRRMDWCSRRARSKAKKIKVAINEVEQSLGGIASEEQVRLHLGLTQEKYAKWLDDAKPLTFIALDKEVESGDGTGLSIHELLADEEDQTGRETLEKTELLELLSQRLAELPDIPKKILVMYYFEDMLLYEIAEVFGLTQSRICQIHTQTILGLRAWVMRIRNR